MQVHKRYEQQPKPAPVESMPMALQRLLQEFQANHGTK